LSEELPYTIHTVPEITGCTLLVGWDDDGSKLGFRVIDFLCRMLPCTQFGEIEPDDFFPLNGVVVQNDIAQFPECKFYYYKEKKLIVLRSSPPRIDWYKFLNTILDAVQSFCSINELYTVGSMVSFAAHTAPRAIMATANSLLMKGILSDFNVNRGIDYESPPGQRPTLSSYLLWVAKRRNIPGASLWVPVPFYLLSSEDPRGCKILVDFLNRKLSLNVDSTMLDKEISGQDKQIHVIRRKYPEISNYIERLENNLGLSEEQSDKLVEIMDKYLRKQP
jgi:predicted ATP-grasp superfamily ATP-dependent carboligase